MPLPGYSVNIVETPPVAGAGGDIGTLFALGRAENPGFGLVYSIDQVSEIFGDRDAQEPYLWDGLQVYFREGGFRAYVAAVDLEESEAEAVAEAADLFVPDYGPGTLTAFGCTETEIHTALAAQTQYSRVAILDAPDTPTVSELVTAANGVTTGAAAPGQRFSAMFAPWDIAPGLVPGATRTVPPSARVAGNMARNDALGYSSGDGAAAALGIAQYIQDLSQPAWSDGDRTALNNAGVNVSRRILSSIRTYGWRSLADQVMDSNWSMFNASRIVMAIKWDLTAVAENFVFSKLDSLSKVTAKFGAAISTVLLEYYNDGDLYGDTSDEAYAVDTGPAVNTAQTFAQGYLKANVGLRTAGMGEQVVINIAKVPITESLASSGTTTTVTG